MNSNTYQLSQPLGSQNNPFVERTIIDPYTGQGYSYYMALNGDPSQFDDSLRQDITPQLEQSNYARQTGAAGWDAPYRAESQRIQAEIARNRAAAEAYLNRGSQQQQQPQQQPPSGGATQGPRAMANTYSSSTYGRQPTGFANMNYGFNPQQQAPPLQQPATQRPDGSWMGNQINGQFGSAANNWGMLPGQQYTASQGSNLQDTAGYGQRSPLAQSPGSTIEAYRPQQQQQRPTPYGGQLPQYGTQTTYPGAPGRANIGGVPLGRPQPYVGRQGGGQGGIPAPIYAPGYQGATNTDAIRPASTTGSAAYPGVSPPGYSSGQYVPGGGTQQYQTTNISQQQYPPQVNQQSYSFAQPPQTGMPTQWSGQAYGQGYVNPFNQFQQNMRNKYPGIR